MNSEPFPIVVSFVLALFAAFAVPTAIAFVLFGMLRREGRVDPHQERDDEMQFVGVSRRLTFPRNRFASGDRD